MIRAIFDYKDQKINSFTVKGHANAADYGQDLVCAAVTAVTNGTVNAIEVLTKTDPDVKFDATGGFLQYIVPQETSVENAQVIHILLQAMVVSLETIQKQNDKHIQIIHNK